MKNDAVYNSRISSLSMFSPQKEMNGLKRKLEETMVIQNSDKLLKETVCSEEKVPIFGTIKFIN